MRDEIIIGLVGDRAKGLEIGPNHAPVFPRARGYDVDILDHAPAEALRAKAALHGIDATKIEDVDFVSDGRPMHEVIPHRQHYDFIFASNVIEHVPDFIRFFESCDMLLKDDGVLVLTVPDKRFCFDAMQAVSTTGDMLQAHLDRRARHSPGRVFDTVANLVLVNGAGAWLPNSYMQVVTQLPLTAAKAEFDLVAAPDAAYVDHHTWRFTPSSMRLIVQDLNDLGLLTLREIDQVRYNGFEFFMSFSRAGGGTRLDRLTLLHRIAEEQVYGFQHMLAAYQPPEADGAAAAGASEAVAS